jgi:hypothetical protein
MTDHTHRRTEQDTLIKAEIADRLLEPRRQDICLASFTAPALVRDTARDVERLRDLMRLGSIAAYRWGSR